MHWSEGGDGWQTFSCVAFTTTIFLNSLRIFCITVHILLVYTIKLNTKMHGTDILKLVCAMNKSIQLYLDVVLT